MSALNIFIRALRPPKDHDLIDRVNYYYTPMILMTVAIRFGLKSCWPYWVILIGSGQCKNVKIFIKNSDTIVV